MRRNKVTGSLLAAGAVTALLLTGCQANAGGSSAETEELKEQIARLEQQISALEQMQEKAANESAAASDAASMTVEGGTQSSPDLSSDPGQQAQADANEANGASAQTQLAGNAGGSTQTSAANTAPVQPQPAGNAGGNAGVQPQPDAGAANTAPAQPQPDAGTANTAPVQPDAGAANTAPVQPQSGNSIEGLTTYTMDELRQKVDAFAAKAGAAAPSGTASQDLEQFFALKQEEEQIDDMLDRHEDELENLYRKNTLTKEEYKQLERELDRLEDKLDDMEDWLERVFGIDD